MLKIMEEAKKYEGKGDPDWKTVTKSVLKTQPPRVQEIPDMVAYCKIWGGYPDGKFVKALSALLSQFMPSTRLVSGQFFKTCAELKFPLDALPSHLINAILFVHAQATSGVTDT